MKYKKICKNPNCGKEFMGTKTQQYCCKECRGEKKSHKNTSLVETAIEARKNGMSYGKYVAMQYQERMKK